MRRLDAGIGYSLGLFDGMYMAGVRAEDIGVPFALGSNDFILFFPRKTQNRKRYGHSTKRSKKLLAIGEIQQIMSKYNKSSSINLPEK